MRLLYGSLIATLLLIGGPANAASRSLICTGTYQPSGTKSVTTVFHLDPVHRRYCEGDCSFFAKLSRVDDELVAGGFEHRDEFSERAKSFTYAPRTGRFDLFEQTMGFASTMTTVVGRCRPKPLPAAILKKMNDAANR